jgi:hypothetical protein
MLEIYHERLEYATARGRDAGTGIGAVAASPGLHP